MNVLLVAKLSNQTLTENILPPLLKSSYVDHVYVLRDFPGDMIDGKVTYLSPEKVSESRIRHIRKVVAGVRYCSKYKIDVIIGVLNTPHGYIGKAIGAMMNIPYIHITIAGHREFWLGGKIRERVNLAVFRKARIITVTGQQTLAYLVSKGFDADRIVVLPNLPNQAFMDSNMQEEGERKYDIVSFSRIDKNKNIGLLLRAVSRIKNECSVKLIVAGDGEELDNLKRMAKELAIGEYIDFVGYISDLEDKLRIYRNSRIFVSCSKGEGFPVSLLEAMSCGCVPVVSNVGDIVDVIRHGTNGFVFNDVDSEMELAGCLMRLLSDKELVDKTSREARKIVESISVEGNAGIWDNVFARITARQ